MRISLTQKEDDPMVQRSFYTWNRLLAGIALFLLLTGCEKGSPDPGKLTPKESVALINATPQLCIVDVRTRHEYKVQHIPQAFNIPAYALHTRHTELADKKIILFYDIIGTRAQTSAKLFRSLYPDAQVFFIRGYPYFSPSHYTYYQKRFTKAHNLLNVLKNSL